MKRTLMFLAILVLFPAVTICGGGGGQPPPITFLETTRCWVYTPADEGTYWLDPNATRSLTFDFESISGGAMLDAAIGKSTRGPAGYMKYNGIQDYNPGTGCFPNPNGTFFYNQHPSLDYDHVHNFVFGFLRPGRQWKDLAVLRQTGVYIYQNTGSGMGGLAQPAFGGAAKDATWGAFSSSDNSEDLAVTDGSQVRIYQNLNNGNVNTTPHTFSIPATHIVLAQMDDNIYNPPGPTNKWDLVSINGNTLSIRLNNGNNGFNAPQDLNMGSAIYSVAVGDINNDYYNDIVLGLESYEVRLYLNNGAGVINTTPRWSITSSVPYRPVALIGDLGNPTDAASNDGWNDLVVTGYGAGIKVFSNQRSGNYFLSEPQQTINGVSHSLMKAMLADVENKGGLSVIYASVVEAVGQPGSADIWVNKHVGDPAPAPPKNVSAGYTPCPSVQHPVISWATNSERDLSGYNIYKSNDGGQQWVKQNTSLITGNSWVDYTEGIACEIHEGWPVWRYYYVTSVDNAVHESSPSPQVSALIDGQALIEKQAGSAAEKPNSYALHTAFPNPFNPSTQIKFDLPEAGHVSLAVYDVLGRIVAELVSDYREVGYHSTTWNAIGQASGVYFARLTVSNELGHVQFTKMNKLMLIR